MALLFLIKDEIHQEGVWADWLKIVAGTIHEDVQCNDEIRKCYKEHVLAAPPRSVYDEQAIARIPCHSISSMRIYLFNALWLQQCYIQMCLLQYKDSIRPPQPAIPGALLRHFVCACLLGLQNSRPRLPSLPRVMLRQKYMHVYRYSGRPAGCAKSFRNS